MFPRKAIVLALTSSLFLLVLGPMQQTGRCEVSPTGETTVGLRNSSSCFLVFYIDGVNMGGVPSGDRSVDFNVSPGQHRLQALATVGTEKVWVRRTVSVSAGHVYTWEITD